MRCNIAGLILVTVGGLFPCLGAGRVEIFGYVRDSAQLPVPQATVVAMEKSSKSRFQLRSAANGRYHLLWLPVGEYRLTVTKTGFEPVIRDGIRVEERVPLDVELMVAAVRQTVETTASAAVLKADSGTVTHGLSGSMAERIPLDGRNFVPLLALTPGVSLAPGSTLPRVNGGRPRVNEYQYDGASVMQPDPVQVAYFPVIDAIEELTVKTNSFSAEYGKSNGGVIQVNMKSGTNAVHGSLFEFFRHDRLNARNYFAAGAEIPRYRRNQFGYTLGGPIRKNRTYFFTDYQGSRWGLGRVRISTVPTALQRQAVFSEAVSGRPVAIYDPATTRIDSGRTVRDLFPGATIPVARWDAAARMLVAAYPTANLNGTANNYRLTATESQIQDQGDIRIDHQITSGQRIFGRLSMVRDDMLPVYPLGTAGGNVADGAVGDTNLRSSGIVVSHSWTLSPNSINEVRVGYSGRDLRRTALRGSGTDQAGVGPFRDTMPTYLIQGFQQLGPTRAANVEQATSLTQIVETFTRLQSGRRLALGVDIRSQRMNLYQPPQPTGAYQFTSLFTGLPGASTSGSGLASFLLGQVESRSVDLQADHFQPRAAAVEFFAQHDWTITPRLSLNTGLRYTLNIPSTDASDRGAVFDLESQKLRFLGQDGFPRGVRDLGKTNLGPRAGVAYRFGKATVARAGYGLVWLEQAGVTPFSIPQFPFLQTNTVASLDGLSPAFPLAQAPAIRWTALDANAGLGQGVFGVDRSAGSAYVQQWNVSLQHRFGNQGSVEVGWVGSKSNRLSGPEPSLNQLPVDLLAIGASLTEPLPNPFYDSMPVSSSLRSATLPRVQLLRPFPRFTTVALYRNNVFQSLYHSLQLHAERRLQRGLTVIGSYTFSKFLDDASSTFEESSTAGPRANFPVADSYNLRLERDRSTGDLPHVLSLGAAFEVGSRKRQPGFSGVISLLMRDWHFSGLFRAQSGIPLAITQQPNFNAFAGFGIQRPNRLANPALPADERSTERFFRTEAFALAPQFTIGNSSRNPVRGPDLVNLDLMAGRVFALTERFKLDFRLEAFNALNTPQFRQPNGILGTPGFGSVTGAFDPRVFEAAIKMKF